MGQTFSSNGRECFGLGAEIKTQTNDGADDDDEKSSGGGGEGQQKEGGSKALGANHSQTENEYPPGHPNYKPKSFKPTATNQAANLPPPTSSASSSSSSAADFKPFISPRYQLHLNLHIGDAAPYPNQADLEPCDQCVRTNRPTPTLVESDVCMCKLCWEEGTEDMRHVVRHRNGVHELCPRDYPASELKFLPDHSDDVVAMWKAEWKHTHGDHDLCRPHYLFGCTAVEELQFGQVQAHQQGDHSNCPAEFPVYMLKPSVAANNGGALVDDDIDELGQDTKEVWCAKWKHEHGNHEACRASFEYGCERGQPVGEDAQNVHEPEGELQHDEQHQQQDVHETKPEQQLP